MNAAYTIEIFSNSTLPAPGHEQGQTFVTAHPVTTDGSGNASFSLPEPPGVYTATATDSTNDTSAFSNAAGAAVSTASDLAVSVNLESGPPALGSDPAYSFAIQNRGTAAATSVKLTHMLPSNVSFVSANASQGSTSVMGGTLTALIGTVAGGSGATVGVVVTPQMVGTVDVAVNVISDQGLLDPSQGMTTLPIDVGPLAPTGTTVTPGTGTSPPTLTVHWNFTPPAGSTATFNIYRSTSPGGEGNSPYVTGVTGTQFTDTTVQANESYSYPVSAVIGGLESPHSTEASGAVLTTPVLSDTTMNDPLNDGAINVTLMYSSPGGNAALYNIYRARMPEGEGATPIAQESLFEMYQAQLDPGSTFYYEVTGVTGGQESPRSKEVMVSVPALTAPVLSATFEGLKIANGTASFRFRWSPSSSALDQRYNLYQATTSGGEGGKPYQANFIGTLLPTPIAQPIGSTYYYEVVPVVEGIEGPPSKEVVTTHSLAMPTLTGFSAEPPLGDGQTFAALEYMSLDGQTPTYNIYRSDKMGDEGEIPFESGVNENPENVPQSRGTTYYYEVSTVDGGAVSPRSNEVTVKTLPLTAPVLQPPMLTLDTAFKSWSYLLQWTTPDPGATQLQFNLYRATSRGGEGATPYARGLIPAEGSGLVTDINPFFQPYGTTVYYKVAPVVNGVEGLLSDELAVPVFYPPPTGIVHINKQLMRLAHGKTASTIVVDFGAALNAANAQNAAIYHLAAVEAAKQAGVHLTKTVKVSKAVYNPATNTVTLTTKTKLPNQPLELSINSGALIDANGQPLDGNNDGQPGGSFQATFGKSGIAIARVLRPK